MTTVTATAQDTEPPRVQVIVSELPADAATVTVYRVADGRRTVVRGALATPATSDVLVLADTEATFGEPLSYVAVVTTTTGTVSETATGGTVTLTADLPWITHPITGVGVACTIAEWSELKFAARQSLVDVAGRAAPLVISDVRTTAESELVLITRTRDQLQVLRELLANGDVLHVRPVCGAVEADYLAVGDASEARIKPTSRDHDPNPAGSDWRRLVTMAVQAVDRPDPTIPAVGDTLADLAAYAPGTLADLADTFGAAATLRTIATTVLAGPS